MMLTPSFADGPARILIVDDEVQNRRLMEIMLTSEGLDLQFAASGVEALASIAQLPPDLVLLDVMMPGMDGYQLAARIKESADTKNIPIIMVTALGDRDAMMQALRAGAEEFLTKPVDRVELNIRVRNLLRLKAYSDHYDRYSGLLEDEMSLRTAELVTSEARKRAILDSALDCIVAVDDEGNITEFNPAAESTFGYRRADLIGKPMVSFLIPPDERARHTAGFLEYKATGQSANLGQPREVMGMRGDGTEFPLTISVVSLDTPGVKGYVAVIRDITESKRLQAEFLQAQKMEALGRLVGGVAHDFNNLLTVIQIYSDLTLERLGANHAVAPDVQEIRKAAQRSTDLTRQLLAFARKQTIVPKVVDLNVVVDSILNLLGRLLGEDVTLGWTPDSALWKVKADAAQLDQVMANLVVNARDAMTGADARLDISTTNVVLDEEFVGLHRGASEGEFVLLRVADNGCGMDTQTLLSIFEPFFTTKAPGQGTGLGMSTVYGIVKQHGGFIDIESTPGVGSTFCIYLRRTLEAEGSTTNGHAEARRPTGETILLVDDEKGVRVLTNKALQTMGYSTLLASSGEDALALSASHTGKIDLVLTDVVMPGMDGRQLYDELVKGRPDLKVLFMSGYDHAVVSSQGVLHPNTNFLAKPFTVTALADAVAASLAS